MCNKNFSLFIFILFNCHGWKLYKCILCHNQGWGGRNYFVKIITSVIQKSFYFKVCNHTEISSAVNQKKLIVNNLLCKTQLINKHKIKVVCLTQSVTEKRQTVAEIRPKTTAKEQALTLVLTFFRSSRCRTFCAALRVCSNTSSGVKSSGIASNFVLFNNFVYKL